MILILKQLRCSFGEESHLLCFWFLCAPDPHEDDARRHVPPADGAGAARLHLNTHSALFPPHHLVFPAVRPSLSCF